MGFITKCFIRKNTTELQKKLEEMGYKICLCANFENAVWLTNYLERGEIHGIGYSDETKPMTVEEALALYLYETDAIDCGDNENLFLALAAMTDDTNVFQWFTDGKDFGYSPKTVMHNKSMPCYHTLVFDHRKDDLSMEDFLNFRKATVEEIIKLFQK